MALEPGIPGSGTFPQREHDKIDDWTGNKRCDVWGFDGANWNRALVDSSGALKTTGGGVSGGTEWDDGDALDTTSLGTLLIATDGIPGTARALRCTPAGLLIVADGGGSLTVDGPLTDAELRAVPVPVSATNLDIRDLAFATDSVSAVQGTSPWVVGGTVAATQSGGWTVAATQSGAWTVAVSGSVAVTGPLTDAQLRASPVPVTQTDSDLMKAKVEGPVAHDSPSSNSPVQIGGIASASAPTPVSADGDAVRVWIDRVGRLQVTIASVSGSVPTDDVTNVVDGQGFAQESDSVNAIGFILDETAGIALSEGDAAAARIDSKRAQIAVIEDETTRGRRLTITAANAMKVDGSAVTQPVDTELPAAAALSDTLANPTTPMVGSASLNYYDNTGGTALWARNRSHYYQETAGVTTGSGAGTAVDMTACPMSRFSLSVRRTSGTVSAYTIALEGSLDGTLYQNIINVASATGNDAVTWTGGVDKGVRYMRYNVASITGAGGTVTLAILACPR